MILTRLLGIVLKLLNEENLTAEQLAESFDVSVRTIYNDISSLIQADVPIISNPGPGGGYSLLQSFYLNREFLSLQELIELLEKINQKTGRGSIEGENDAIEKIFSVMPENRGENLLADAEFTIKPSGFEDMMLDKLKKFNQAIKNDRQIRLAVLDNKHSNIIDLVNPVDIICQKFIWFVSAYSSKKGNYILYSLSNIKNYQIVDEAGQFQNKISADIELTTKSPEYSHSGFSHENIDKDSDYGEGEHISCHLLFSQEVADRVHKLFPQEAIMEEKEELFVITTWPDNIWLRRTILSFGSKVKVLSPSWLAEEIKKIAAQTAAQYHLAQED